MSDSRTVEVSVTPIYSYARNSNEDRVQISSLLKIADVTIMLDCGWTDEFEISDLMVLRDICQSVDAVLISQGDLEHCGGLPFLYGKLQCKADLYMTKPTFHFAQLMLFDHVISNVRENPDFSVIGVDDIRSAFDQNKAIHVIEYMTVELLRNSVSISASNSGHLAGGSVWRINKRSESIVYAPVFNHRNEKLLGKCQIDTISQSPSAFITEAVPNESEFLIQLGLPGSTFDRETAAQGLILTALQTLHSGGSVLVPCDTSGRVLELLLRFHTVFVGSDMFPVYFLNPVASSVIDYARSMGEYFNDVYASSGSGSTGPLGSSSSGASSPFHFKSGESCVRVTSDAEEVGRAVSTSPCVVLASLPTLSAGFSRSLFMRFLGMPSAAVLFPDLFLRNPSSIPAQLLQLNQEFNLNGAGGKIRCIYEREGDGGIAARLTTEQVSLIVLETVALDSEEIRKRDLKEEEDRRRTMRELASRTSRSERINVFSDLTAEADGTQEPEVDPELEVDADVEVEEGSADTGNVDVDSVSVIGTEVEATPETATSSHPAVNTSSNTSPSITSDAVAVERSASLGHTSVDGTEEGTKNNDGLNSTIVGSPLVTRQSSGPAGPGSTSVAPHASVLKSGQEYAPTSTVLYLDESALRIPHVTANGNLLPPKPVPTTISGILNNRYPLFDCDLHFLPVSSEFLRRSHLFTPYFKQTVNEMREFYLNFCAQNNLSSSSLGLTDKDGEIGSMTDLVHQISRFRPKSTPYGDSICPLSFLDPAPLLTSTSASTKAGLSATAPSGATTLTTGTEEHILGAGNPALDLPGGPLVAGVDNGRLAPGVVAFLRARATAPPPVPSRRAKAVVDVTVRCRLYFFPADGRSELQSVVQTVMSLDPLMSVFLSPVNWLYNEASALAQMSVGSTASATSIALDSRSENVSISSRVFDISLRIGAMAYKSAAYRPLGAHKVASVQLEMFFSTGFKLALENENAEGEHVKQVSDADTKEPDQDATATNSAQVSTPGTTTTASESTSKEDDEAGNTNSRQIKEAVPNINGFVDDIFLNFKRRIENSIKEAVDSEKRKRIKTSETLPMHTEKSDADVHDAVFLRAGTVRNHDIIRELSRVNVDATVVNDIVVTSGGLVVRRHYVSSEVSGSNDGFTLEIEGPISEEYYNVRKAIYALYTIV